ncbi:DUF4389 domain-containing protein [Streptomyces sp. NPDC057445]|uniref:DUF4389 domain-containing protein n=1 Tax=Streptomyces sp. NPDC057445 TaxID=3346136 RepID=UPI003686DD06
MADPTWAARPYPATAELLPELDLPEPGRQRRWTVLLRWLLLVPQYIAVLFLGIAAFFVTIVGWFAALFSGRLPESIASFLSGYLVYATRVNAYAMLLVDAYPPFAFHAPGHPVQVEVHPGELNRLAVLFRIILVIPAAVVDYLVTAGWYVISFIFWLLVLILGRMPRPLFEATAATVRYAMRVSAYLMMLTAAYPKHLFGDETHPTEPPRSASRPLLLSGAGKALVVLFLVLGVLYWIFSATGSVTMNNGTTSQPALGSSAGPRQRTAFTATPAIRQRSISTMTATCSSKAPALT